MNKYVPVVLLLFIGCSNVSFKNADDNLLKKYFAFNVFEQSLEIGNKSFSEPITKIVKVRMAKNDKNMELKICEEECIVYSKEGYINKHEVKRNSEHIRREYQYTNGIRTGYREILSEVNDNGIIPLWDLYFKVHYESKDDKIVEIAKLIDSKRMRKTVISFDSFGEIGNVEIYNYNPDAEKELEIDIKRNQNGHVLFFCVDNDLTPKMSISEYYPKQNYILRVVYETEANYFPYFTQITNVLLEKHYLSSNRKVIRSEIYNPDNQKLKEVTYKYGNNKVEIVGYSVNKNGSKNEIVETTLIEVE
jgi:hypothetical protein